jgi:hypothetical protein
MFDVIGMKHTTTFQDRIKHGDRVTILVPAGIGRNGQEWAERTGKAVMYSSTGGWVLNMGGRYGTPGIASETNTVAIKGKRIQ